MVRQVGSVSVQAKVKTGRTRKIETWKKQEHGKNTLVDLTRQDKLATDKQRTQD
jgi:hypothetical protein